MHEERAKLPLLDRQEQSVAGLSLAGMPRISGPAIPCGLYESKTAAKLGSDTGIQKAFRSPVGSVQATTQNGGLFHKRRHAWVKGRHPLPTYRTFIGQGFTHSRGRHCCLLRRFSLRGLCDRLTQILRRLRPADGELTAEDEHRHALNAGVLRHLRFLFDFGDILAGGESRRACAGSSPTSAAACTRTSVSDRSAPSAKYRSIGAASAQALSNCFRPADEAMRIAGVRLAIDAAGRIDDPFAGDCSHDALSDVLVSFRRAEFGGEILLAGHSLERDHYVEEIGPKMHLDRNAGLHCERLFHPLLPMKHHGQTTSDTTSMRTGFDMRTLLVLSGR